MTINLPNALSDIRAKARRISGRPSANQLSDADLDDYINTVYVYNLSQHLKLESLRYNYQFTTSPNIPVYDLPTGTYLTAMPPVFIGGYQSYMTQSRENFFRINPQLNFLQQNVYTGNGGPGPYTGQFLTNTPIIPGFKTNPPGAYTANAANLIAAEFLNWNVIVSALGTPANSPTNMSGISPAITLIDDGLGHLIAPDDPGTTVGTGFNYLGTINYITGAIDITQFPANIPSGNPINVQYIPYVASRPQSAVFYQDQIILYPIPDQAYTVSFEAYRYPTAFLSNVPSSSPQVNEWWETLAVGAALKIFEDNGDMEGYARVRPLYDEYLRMIQRRTITQQTSERTATIYTEQSQFPQYPFGNLFSGF